jgi:hypothetical protein
VRADATTDKIDPIARIPRRRRKRLSLKYVPTFRFSYTHRPRYDTPSRGPAVPIWRDGHSRVVRIAGCTGTELDEEGQPDSPTAAVGRHVTDPGQRAARP